MANSRGVDCTLPLTQSHWMMALLSVTLGVLLTGCSVGYLWHVTLGQAKLLMRQQPVDDVVQDSQLSEDERQKIRLILDVRTFATKDYAFREEQKLAAQSYDTYVLGYFNDPILSCMLTYSDATLVNTISHELLHQTVWIKGHVSFNESLANFVGAQGALAYLKQRYGAEAPEVQHYRDVRDDAKVFEAYMHTLIERLQTLYQQPISRADKLHRREELFTEAKTAYPTVFPAMQTPNYRRYFERRTLNNDVLLSFQQYHHDRSLFEHALAAHNGDLRHMIVAFKTLRIDQIPASFRKR